MSNEDKLDYYVNILADISNSYRNKEMSNIDEYDINQISSGNSIEESINLYNTDLSKQSCNCKDWAVKRNSYKYNDPRRFCKHLIFLLDIDNLKNELLFFKEDFQYYKSNNKGYKLNFEEVIKVPNTNYKLQVNYERDWMNLFDENGLKYGVLLDEYNQIHWTKQIEKPNDYKIVELFLVELLIGDTPELTVEEKNKIQNELNTTVTEYFQKCRKNDYIIYGMDWDSEKSYEEGYENYGEELHWSYIIVNKYIIYLNLNGRNTYITREIENKI